MKRCYVSSVQGKSALAFAVGCWLLCGGMAQAQDVFGHGDATNKGDISGVSWTLNQDVSDVNYSNTFNAAYTQSGNVSNNSLVINGGNFAVSGSKGGFANWFYCGNTDNGAATGNSIVINDGTFTNSTNTNQAAGIYAGFARNGHTASGNSVTINGGSFDGYTYSSAAVSADGDAIKNTTTVNAGNFERGVYLFGGRANNTGNTNDNTVNVVNGTIGGYRAFVWGGKADKGNAIGNTVNIIGGVIADSVADPGDGLFDKQTYSEYYQGAAEIYGGYTLNGTAANNTVNVSGGTISSNGEGIIYGGYSRSGDATGNVANISGGTAEKKLTIFGGFATNGNANGNTVNVTGGDGKGTVYLNGGVTMSDTGNATGNTVAIYMPAQVNVAVGGVYLTGTAAKGFTWNKTNSGDLKTGNKLLLASSNISIGNIYNFETLAFQVPSTLSGSMLTITDGSNTDISNTTVEITAAGDASLSSGQRIGLISSNSTLNYNGATTGTLRQGVTLQYDYTLDNTANNLSATLGQATLNGETKSLVETRAAQTALIDRGADLLINQGFQQATDATGKSDNWEPFVGIQAGKFRYDTGSHIDSSGWNGILGLAKEKANKHGSLLTGIALEYGNNDYDSYMDDIHGEGKAKYMGAVLFARQAAHNGLYYEGSLRYGRSDADYKSSDFSGYKGIPVSYKTDSTYWGAHLGLGKIISLSKTDDLDISLRYLYAHNGSDSERLSTGETYDFDAVNSHRLRAGLRWTRNFNERNALYAGLAYQYEFNGDARADYRGFGLASPSLKGSSGILEVGYRLKPAKDRPFTLDFNVSGWTGQQRGATGQISLTYSL